MRPAGNLAGVEFIHPPRYHNQTDEWKLIISESGYWFSMETMRYFSTRISWDSLTAVDPENYLFITSEQDTSPDYSGGRAWGGARRYSVRTWNLETGVDSAGEFGTYETRQLATAALKQHVKQLTNN